MYYLEKGHGLNAAQDFEEEDAYDPKDTHDLNGENLHDLYEECARPLDACSGGGGCTHRIEVVHDLE